MLKALSPFTFVGANPTGSRDIRLGTITVDLFHKSERDIPQEDIEVVLFDRLSNIADARFLSVDDRGERGICLSGYW